MTQKETRLGRLEKIWPKPAGNLSPAREAQLREAVDRVSVERGLDPDEVMAEARRMLAEGWTPPKGETR